MLSLWKRKPESIATEPVPQSIESARRNRQQNIKVSEDCAAHFTALAKAQGMSRAELFEDMVAERLEALQRRGMKVEVSSA
jgi:hypothetical protein